MSLYTSIAPYYDLLFPYDDTQIRFLETVINPNLDIGKKIRLGKKMIYPNTFLDIGCATGTLVSHFSHYFKKCYGVDNDKGILSIAAEKVFPGQKKEIELLDESMTDIGYVFREEEFSLITCLGNTLPHLKSINEVSNFFQEVHKRLEDFGVFVFQIINYDRIVQENIKSLPTIQRGEICFIRNYSLISKEGFISFDSILIDPKNEEIKNSTSLLVLFKEDLEKTLKKAGFANVSFFGDYSGQQWSPDSFLTIGVCEIS